MRRFALSGLVIAIALLAMATGAQSGTPSCLGKSVTQDPGTNGDDNLTGTSGNDVIVGKGGNDTIDGKGGDDRICGNGGKDEIDAGSGKDQVSGDDGADKIDVADGEADVADGGGGSDTCKTDPSDKVKSCVSESVPQCSDGVDNDNDGKTDTADPGCSGSSDDSESPDPAKPQCSDGVDNDNDGKTDTADPGCSASWDNSEDSPDGSADLAVNDALSAPQIDDSGNPYYVYEVAVTNSGPSNASPPTVTIEVPANFTVQSFGAGVVGIENTGDPAECKQSGNTVTCSFYGSVETTSGYYYDVGVTGVFTSAAPGTFTATVSSSTPDPDSSNNLDSTTATPAQCANGVDDDSDGQVDYPADSDCADAADTES